MTASPSAVEIVSRARNSGKIPPSLIDSAFSNDDDFFIAVSNIISHDEFALRNGVSVPEQFQAVLKLSFQDSLPSDVDVTKRNKLLTQRRAILLAITGVTPHENLSLEKILEDGYILTVKIWLDEILSNTVGSVDLLLHLLSSICTLPVTKEMVTSSKLGKQVVAVEKHKICVGSMNEAAIKERVDKVKEMWSASVKRMKKYDQKNSNSDLKRTLEPNANDAGMQVKKAKTENTRKSLLSGLIKRGSPQNNKSGNELNNNGSTDTEDSDEKQKNSASTGEVKTKKQKHIKWADNNGGNLLNSGEVEKDSEEDQKNSVQRNTDQKKRDRLREKELLQKARKSKLVEEEDNFDSMVLMYSAWQQPNPLILDAESPSVNVDSKELLEQVKRMSSVLSVNYVSDSSVPSDPSPLTAVEESNDIASQSSVVSVTIPFFVPEQEEASTPVAAPLPIPTMVPPTPAIPTNFPPPNIPPPVVPSNAASVEIVKAMGLPPFLAGQNIQALQTLSASPGLLNAFVDPTGAPDQVKILNLVQTLTQNIPSRGVQAPPPIMPHHSLPQPTYGQPYGSVQPNQYQPPPQPSIYGINHLPTNGHATATSKGYRGDQNVSDGNLHLSGYGPTTTPESIIALFSPYTKVDEVVPKNGFMFVNTSDPDGAKRAREALNGVMLGGSPLRINVALRRNKNVQNPGMSGIQQPHRPERSEVNPLPRNVLGQIDYDNVRDDRGNPATKNLFVAGYGQETTENDLRELFNQHTQVTGVVLKGSFAFVNTSDKNSAVHAREALTGTVIAGGVLRINFAKESGRLGTSFDNGYSSSRSQAGPSSYYGRSNLR